MLTKNPLKAVFFDFDDTLFDHSRASLAGLAALQTQYPALLEIELPLLFKVHIDILEKFHIQVLRKKISLDMARTERFIEFFQHFNVNLSLFDVDNAKAIYREAYQANRYAMEGAVELLQALQGRCKIGLITNNLASEQIAVQQICDLNHFIEFMVTPEDAGVEKPAPGIFTNALEQAGFAAAECCMVGDSWNRDILGAVSCQIPALWFNRSAIPCPSPGLVPQCANLGEVKEYLLKRLVTV